MRPTKIICHKGPFLLTTILAINILLSGGGISQTDRCSCRAAARTNSILL